MSSEGEAPWETPSKAASRSFLVRCYRAGGGAGHPFAWRFMIVEAGGGTSRRVFSGLDGLVAYLRAELEVDQPSGPALRAEEVKGE